MCKAWRMSVEQLAELISSGCPSIRSIHGCTYCWFISRLSSNCPLPRTQIRDWLTASGWTCSVKQLKVPSFWRFTLLQWVHCVSQWWFTLWHAMAYPKKYIDCHLWLGATNFVLFYFSSMNLIAIGFVFDLLELGSLLTCGLVYYCWETSYTAWAEF